MTPCITDNDNGEITAEIDGDVRRSWRYDQFDWNTKMRMAREFAEGWHQAMEVVAARSRQRTAEMNAELPEDQRNVMSAKGMI